MARDLAARRGEPALLQSHAFTSSSIKAIFPAPCRVPGYSDGLFTVLKEHGYQVAIVSGQNESFGGMAETLRMREAAVHFFDATMAPSERVFPSTDPGSLTLSNARVLRQFATVADQLDWTRPVSPTHRSGALPVPSTGHAILLDGVKPIERSRSGGDTEGAAHTTDTQRNAETAASARSRRAPARGVLGNRGRGLGDHASRS